MNETKQFNVNQAERERKATPKHDTRTPSIKYSKRSMNEMDQTNDEVDLGQIDYIASEDQERMIDQVR